MNLRTSFALCLLFVVWVATCVFAYVTHENRPCLTIYPGAGTGDCAQTSCHEFLDPDDHCVYYVKSKGVEYRKCGSSEYFLNCEEQDPSTSRCAVWYKYCKPENCEQETNGSILYERSSGVPSCKKYSWQ